MSRSAGGSGCWCGRFGIADGRGSATARLGASLVTDAPCSGRPAAAGKPRWRHGGIEHCRAASAGKKSIVETDTKLR